MSIRCKIKPSCYLVFFLTEKGINIVSKFCHCVKYFRVKCGLGSTFSDSLNLSSVRFLVHGCICMTWWCKTMYLLSIKMKNELHKTNKTRGGLHAMPRRLFKLAYIFPEILKFHDLILYWSKVFLNKIWKYEISSKFCCVFFLTSNLTYFFAYLFEIFKISHTYFQISRT